VETFHFLTLQCYEMLQHVDFEGNIRKIWQEEE